MILLPKFNQKLFILSTLIFLFNFLFIFEPVIKVKLSKKFGEVLIRYYKKIFFLPPILISGKKKLFDFVYSLSYKYR